MAKLPPDSAVMSDERRWTPKIRAVGLTILCSFVLIRSAFAQHPSIPKAGTLDGLGVNIHFTDPQPGEMDISREPLEGEISISAPAVSF